MTGGPIPEYEGTNIGFKGIYISKKSVWKSLTTSLAFRECITLGDWKRVWRRIEAIRQMALNPERDQIPGAGKVWFSVQH
jgi:hypothetical protein